MLILRNYIKKNFLRDCIQKAKANDEKDLKNINIEYQEGVKWTPGSPDIIQEIENRIDNCHIFIGDVTLLIKRIDLRNYARGYGIKYKITPNPNVINVLSRFRARTDMGYLWLTVMNNLNGDLTEDERLMFVKNNYSSY